MIKWILVILMASHIPAVQIEFDSQYACEAARQKIQSDFDAEQVRWEAQVKATNPNAAILKEKSKTYCFQKQ